MSDNLIQVYTVYINAPASQIWAAITTSAGTTKWGYGGDVEYDLTAGRRLPQPDHRGHAADGHGRGGGVRDRGARPRRTPGWNWTWQPAWHPESKPTRLIWELTEFDGPVTKVVLTHDLSAAPEYADGGRRRRRPGAGRWRLAVESVRSEDLRGVAAPVSRTPGATEPGSPVPGATVR